MIKELGCMNYKVGDVTRDGDNPNDDMKRFSKEILRAWKDFEGPTSFMPEGLLKLHGLMCARSICQYKVVGNGEKYTLK